MGGAVAIIHRTPRQRSQKIDDALTMLAEGRQASISENALLFLPKLLADCDADDIDAACKQLGMEGPRGEFPDAGTIISRAEAIRRKRTAPRVFEPCGNCAGGQLLVNSKGEPWSYERDRFDRQVKACSCKREWLATRQRMAQFEAEAAFDD